ncbi:MAG: histidine kinase, partial [Actinomycetota bacterium]|nr:histidine kinase [Actinomycetota bacterium]
MRDRATAPVPPLNDRTALAGGALAMAGVAMFGESGAFRWLTVVAALAGLVPWAFVAARRPLPLPVFMLVTLGAAAVIVVGAGNPGGMFPPMLAIVYVARSTSRRPVVAAAVVASALMIVTLAVIEGSAYETGIIYFLGGLGISLLAGLMLRRQELLTAEVQEMHTLTVEHAAVTERTHIAREVHDVVAHSLTVVLLNLTGARRALRTDPGRADEALARAESVGRASLESVRQMVDLLRAESGTSSSTGLPQPGLGELHELVERARAGGLTVTVDVAPEAATIDPALALVVFRIVQESLSNALQHAPGAPCTITLDGRRLE